jgi:hypothetical protein
VVEETEPLDRQEPQQMVLILCFLLLHPQVVVGEETRGAAVLEMVRWAALVVAHLIQELVRLELRIKVTQVETEQVALRQVTLAVVVAVRLA